MKLKYLFILVGCCLALRAADVSVLVWETKGNIGFPLVLNCHYFSGIGFYSIDYWHTENALIGKRACPGVRKE